MLRRIHKRYRSIRLSWRYVESWGYHYYNEKVCWIGHSFWKFSFSEFDWILLLVKPLRNLLETAQALGATQFIEYAIDSEIEFDLTQSESALTVFVPTNEAFQVINWLLIFVFIWLPGMRKSLEFYFVRMKSIFNPKIGNWVQGLSKT
jgi:hypothetical protein